MKLCQACGAVKVFSLPAGPLKLLACEAVKVFFACGAVKVFFVCVAVKVSLPAGLCRKFSFACEAVKVFVPCGAV